MGDLVILAKGTLERTSRKKDPSGTPVACNRRFFTEMRPYISNP